MESPRFATLEVPNIPWVIIKHRYRNQMLLQFPCTDRSKDGATPGIHYETVLTACAIIAGNQFGKVHLERDQPADEHTVDLKNDDILPGGVYRLLIDNTQQNDYRTVKNFRDWQFPHGRLPESWTAAKRSFARIPRKQDVCAVSAKTTSVYQVSILSNLEEEWWTANRMSDVCNPFRGRGLKNVGNDMCLKVDLASAFRGRE
ncbi:hypothetical protein V8F33_006556 [Rhypophila sp. PSN 637]